MLRKSSTLFILLALACSFSASAKIWRVNNNTAVDADFVSLTEVSNSASVLAGDTIYMEPSATVYQTGNVLNKRLVIIGPGYYLDPTDTNFPVNPGLHVPSKPARLAFFRVSSGADGSVFMGLTLDGSVYLNGASNLRFEKNDFGYGGIYFENGTNNNISIRKNFFYSAASIHNSTGVTNPVRVITNLVIENNIFWGGYINLGEPTGSGNIFRNNSISNSGYGFTFSNFYVANNIFGTGAAINFTNCTIKNNLFSTNQTLPGTATNNQVNVAMANVYTGGTTNALDARHILKAGSPAIGAGLTVGAVVSPDCGAFGATDPYKLSGIPAIPTIYALTVPTSIPSGSATMNVTFSTRNNQ